MNRSRSRTCRRTGACVRIRQVVRALDGTKISEGSFDHLYRFQGGLIERMDIQNLEVLPR